ncbi:MAG: DUF3313 domain-containing protein [Gammaproteobacteria bacterium]|nr:DUF3313 domain-containing protein [Gammaproteobacteria bacterium]
MKYVNIVLIGLMLAACASSRVTSERNYSGFLDDYSMLEETELDTGGVGLIWVDPDIADKSYTKAILEPIVIYPGPKRDSDEAKAFIKEVTTYMDAAIQAAVGDTIIITDSPGPNTVRVRFALTGVDISNEGLSSYEYVPVAMLFVGAKTAAGARAQAVEVFFEAEMVDSISGEVLGRSVRKGYGESLENKSETLTKEAMYPQLDLWAADAANIANLVRGE